MRTNAETGVTAFRWSPDGKSIAFTSSEADPKEEKLRKETYGDYEVVKADYAMSHLWLVEVASPERHKRLTGQSDASVFSVGGFSWSPDGKQIAFQTADGKKYHFYQNSVIAVVPAEGGAPRILSAAFDEDPNLVGWSPEGIYFSAQQKTWSHRPRSTERKKGRAGSVRDPPARPLLS